MRLPLPAIAALGAFLVLSACAPVSGVETADHTEGQASRPVPIDIVDARFNIPALLPQVDIVRRMPRDNGTVIQETYFVGEARVAVVEHAGNAWFNSVSIVSVRDRSAFRTFLARTPMRDAVPEISEVSGDHGAGSIARAGRCLAFRFLKRVKGDTGYENDNQDPDTFVVGYSCDLETDRIVEAFGFMSADDAARVERRSSI
jgi:hypothetical protein